MHVDNVSEEAVITVGQITRAHIAEALSFRRIAPDRR